jgi:hypothetical protein
MSYAQPIRAEDAHAVEQLQARIAEAERLQEKMKAANKIVRDKKLNDAERIARLGSECSIPPDGARKLLQPDFAGRIGFPNYALTNNAANIRRMQARVGGLAKESVRPSVTVEFPGGRIEDDAAACRIRIYHDAKPTLEVIRQLKLHGFHWSSRLKCWSRLRNDSARFYATAITGAHWPDAARALVRLADGEAIPSVATSSAAAAARMGIAP